MRGYQPHMSALVSIGFGGATSHAPTTIGTSHQRSGRSAPVEPHAMSNGPPPPCYFDSALLPLQKSRDTHLCPRTFATLSPTAGGPLSAD